MRFGTERLCNNVRCVDLERASHNQYWCKIRQSDIKVIEITPTIGVCVRKFCKIQKKNRIFTFNYSLHVKTV